MPKKSKPDAKIAELEKRIEALENKPAPAPYIWYVPYIQPAPVVQPWTQYPIITCTSGYVSCGTITGATTGPITFTTGNCPASASYNT